MAIRSTGDALDGTRAASRPSRRRHRRGAPLATLVASATVATVAGGCTLPTGLAGMADRAGEALARAGERPEATAAELAAPAVADLVGALVQLREPRLTTVQVGPRTDDPVGDALVAALADAGYGIQRVAADQGANHVGWRFGAVSDPAPGADAVAAPVAAPMAAPVAALGVADGAAGGAADGRLRARLDVGPLSLERDYLPGPAGGLVAASPLEIGGTRTRVALADDTRLPGTPAVHSRVTFGAAAPTPTAAPIISLVTDEVVRGVTARATGGTWGAAPRRGVSRQAINSNRVEVTNLFFGESAFGALRADLRAVTTGTILFGDDSMRLGADGKRQIARFVEDYRPGTDMIGLVGCSNGPTRLEIGNEGLALGRSARVTEELVALGVDRSRVLDEGCWAGSSAGERFPSRGVVMELLRPAS